MKGFKKRGFKFLNKKFLLLFLLLLNLGFIFAFTLTGLTTEQSSPSKVNVTAFQVIRDNYDGSTTTFLGVPESTLRNMSGVVLENTSYGRIDFNENLDMVTMAGDDYVVNFDRDLNISDNLINVNNNNLTGIDVSANLSLYGINYTAPQIYHNGVLCGSECSQISYADGVFKFKVTFLTGVYWLRETPTNPPVCGNGICESGETSTTCSIDCGGSSGGGGSGGGGGSSGGSGVGPSPIISNETNVSSKGYDFKIDPNFFQLRMEKGTYYQKYLNITNNGTKDLTLTLSVTGLENFIFPETSRFSLKPGESKYLRLDVYVSNSRAADVYVGKVNFVDSHLTKSADVILQVKETAVLFDIRTTVLKKYIPPGGRVRANISLINKGDLRNFDVNLVYKAMDFDKNVYTLKEEQFAIDKYYNNVFYLDLPRNMSIGNYVFYAQVRYKNVSASSYDTFVIEEISTFSWILLILIILLAMYLVYRYYRDFQKKGKFDFGQKRVGVSNTKTETQKKQKPMKVPELPEDFE